MKLKTPCTAWPDDQLKARRKELREHIPHLQGELAHIERELKRRARDRRKAGEVGA